MKIPAKNWVMRAVNLCLFLGGCLMAGTGWVIDQRMPRGRDGRGLSLLGLGRHDWGEVHAWTGYILVGLVALHLILHWQWLVKIAAAHRPWRLAAGLIAGLAVVGFFALAPVRG